VQKIPTPEQVFTFQLLKGVTDTRRQFSVSYTLPFLINGQRDGQATTINTLCPHPMGTGT